MHTANAEATSLMILMVTMSECSQQHSHGTCSPLPLLSCTSLIVVALMVVAAQQAQQN